MGAQQLFLVLLKFIVLLLPIKASTPYSCPQSCGNISIRYPFGIGKGCYFSSEFEVTCDNSKPSLPSMKLPLSESLSYSSRYKIGVNFPIISLKNSSSNITGGFIDLSRSPFSISTLENSFISVGCDSYASQQYQNGSTTAAKCQSFCNCDPSKNVAGCCDVICTLPENGKFNNTVSISDFYSERIPPDCDSAFIVDQQWLQSNYLTDPTVLRGKKQVNARLEWGTYKGYCVELYYESGNTSCNNDGYCIIEISYGHICLCNNLMSDRFQGCTGKHILYSFKHQ